MDGDPAIKYAKLEPKGSSEGQLAMSKVHISKSWRLPPRSTPVRRPLSKQYESPTSDEEERKKRQNRDAQRAYRERRTNRIQELEDTVETLQGMVKNWQKKYRAIESELEDVTRENEDLKKRNAGLTSKLDGAASSEAMPFLDPLLHTLIENFKPMKAVTLKRRKLEPTKPTTGCGFCSETTACVCKELEDEGVETVRCTENTATCTQCSDIDKSCIKPKAPVRPGDTSTDFLTLEGEDRPNTMDPDFVPGSCNKCQSDPQSKAFCQAVYGPPSEGKKVSCCSEPHMGSKSSEFIPISDAYQRVKKYMQASEQDSSPMKHIASGLRVRGREVELRSIDDAIRDMDKNAIG